MSTTTSTGLHVSELAAAAGVRPDTVRYYEKAGLLPAPPRTEAGYRRYPRHEIDRIQFIRGCQRLGLRLREIADLLAVRDTGVCPCEPAEDLLQRRIAEIDAELARLTSLRGQLVSTLHSIPDGECPDLAPAQWCPPDEGKEVTNDALRL